MRGQRQKEIYVRPEEETPLTGGEPSLRKGKQRSQKRRADPGPGGRTSPSGDGRRGVGRRKQRLPLDAMLRWDLINHECWGQLAARHQECSTPEAAKVSPTSEDTQMGDTVFGEAEGLQREER